MLLTGALTVWFNLQHAGSDPGRRLAAALPPVLMMLAFEIDVQIVRWVMRALGKPMGPIAPPPPSEAMLRGPVPGVIYRADALGWNVPPDGPPAGWPRGPYGPNPAGQHLPENRQNGQPGLTTAEDAGGAGVIKRQRIEAYLDRLGSEQLPSLTVREITSDLRDEGLDVTERYVKHVLDQQQPTPQPPRRRGSGPRRPRR